MADGLLHNGSTPWAIEDEAQIIKASPAQPAKAVRKVPISVSNLQIILRGLDVLTIIVWAVLAWQWSQIDLWSATVAEVLPLIVYCGTSIAALRIFSTHVLGMDHALGLKFARLIAALVIPASIALFVFGRFNLTLPSEVLWLAVGASTATFVTTHVGSILLVRAWFRAGRLSENVVIVGATPNAQSLIDRNAETQELNVLGIFDDRMSRLPDSIGGSPILGQLDDLINWERLPDVDRIIVTVTSEARERVRHLIDRLRVLPQRVVLLLDLEGFDPENQTLAEIARSPAAYVSGAPQDRKRATIKRLTDLFFGTAMLIVFSPILLIAACAIKLDSPGPVFFRQNRHGFNNKIIRVWKFRSMTFDPGAQDRMVQQTQVNDSRVTRVGRFIRQTSIDELPQLLNVLSGEMSIVGPRPHAIGMETEKTEVHKIVGEYAHRHRVKPGITGWAQINGSRGPVNAKDEVRERVRLDMEYVNMSSFWLDFYIMLMTAPCLLGDARRAR